MCASGHRGADPGFDERGATDEGNPILMCNDQQLFLQDKIGAAHLKFSEVRETLLLNPLQKPPHNSPKLEE